MPDPAGPKAPILGYRGPDVAEVLPTAVDPPVIEYRHPRAEVRRSYTTFRRRVQLMFDLYWLLHLACVMWVLVCVGVAIAAVIHAFFHPRGGADRTLWTDLASQVISTLTFGGVGVVALVIMHVLWRRRWRARAARRSRGRRLSAA